MTQSTISLACVLLFSLTCSISLNAAEPTLPKIGDNGKSTVFSLVLYTPPLTNLLIPNASINMQNAIGDLQQKKFYFQELKRKMNYMMDELETELNLTNDQLTGIRSLLQQIDAEEKALLLARVEKMCAVWNDSTDLLSDSERADKALSVYERQETLDLTRNEAKQNFFNHLADLAGADKTNLIRENMARFIETNTMTAVAWSDVIRSIGLETNQLEFTCATNSEPTT